ncbi:aldo/keto reductase [uncultured Tateyamaria sp.]|uniref:aldo/keto reductase n=1 Tax=uncultured Tateyamaria sp. TaxID=455651 RepID=UPI00262B2D27|nr:aldo/keto reductase [uncultured Tateyamaria sp.]
MHFTTRPVGQTSLRLPTLGFGTAPLGGLFDAVNGTEAGLTLAEALATGMGYVDTAPFYGFGLSERRVGDQLRGRPHLISTKVGRLLEPGPVPDPAEMGWPDALPFHPVHDYTYDGVMRSFDHSLQRLGLDRVDILYVHDIGEMTLGADNAKHFKDLADGGYRALDELRAAGRIKAIGLGVNEVQICLDALEIGEWDVFLLAGRYTLLEQTALDALLPKCAARGMSIVVGGPFNSGILAGGKTWNYAAAPAEVVARVQALRAVCQDFDVPLSAAALQFPLGHDVVCSVIPGLRNRAELADTLRWAAHPIPSAFWETLKQRALMHPDAPTPRPHPFEEAQG